MAYKKYTTDTEETANNLEEAAATYYTESYNKMTVVKSVRENENEFIKRSVTLMGMGNVKPFNKVTNNIDFIDCIRDGLPRNAMDNLMTITGITTDEITKIIRTSDRTLRRYTAQQKLNAEQSERIIELAKLYSRGEEVFGSIEDFNEWMKSVVMALGNKKPKEFLDTSLGFAMLMDELGKIEHGVFA